MADAAALGGLKVRAWRAAYAEFVDPAYLRARGHAPLCVYAYAPNHGARRFYRRAGFATTG